MRLLLVQLSDIHFRATSNPIVGRVRSLAAAVRSTGATPDACLILVTGDVAWSGLDSEYSEAAAFFSSLHVELERDLPNTPIEFFVIPGNHDCLLQTEKTGLRKVVVEAVSQLPQTANPDPGITTDLLSAQDDFFKFSASLGFVPQDWNEKLCTHRSIQIHDKNIRVNLFNTAFLSQRQELPTLSLPQSLLESSILPDPSADLTISLHHHSEGWLEATFKRFFRKLIETTSDIVFTGHEHESDYHLTHNINGNNITYIEGDALQDAENPHRSGFNCLLVDFIEHKQTYFLFRWKGSKYSAIVDAKEHPLRIVPKGGAYFRFNERYLKWLSEDSFGFRHTHRPLLMLDDVFVYPSVTRPIAKGKHETIQGKQLVDRILKDKYALFYGPELSGKTSLFKMMQKDIFSSSAIIPVMLEGADVSAQSEDALLKKVWSRVAEQFSDDCVEDFRQLPRERRALLIDNLDDSSLRPEKMFALLKSAKRQFGVIVASVRSILGSVYLYSPEKSGEPDSPPLLQLSIIGEMRPSGRGQLIEKWISLDSGLAADSQALSKAIETEQSTIDFLIGKHVLPSLPYLVIGVLQARQRGKDDMQDPGSFGYIVQRIVLDALSVASGRNAMIERKDYLLRSLAFYLFQHGQSQVSEREFETVVAEFAKRKMINANAEALLDDLVQGRILEKIDSQIQFKYEHFQYYFLALQFIDEIDGDSEVTIREHLNNMADKPLVRSNRLTLIFFLFFRKRDPVIDRLIEQANSTFSDHIEADLLSDVPTESEESLAFVNASVDENVDVNAERERRWQEEDKVADQSEEEQEWDRADKPESKREDTSLDIRYEESKSIEQRSEFAEARLALLGQIIRNFPDSLDGERKVQILEAAIKLGLRGLHAGLELIRELDTRVEDVIRLARATKDLDTEKVLKLWRIMIALIHRLGCNIALLEISRAVGVNELEEPYTAAIERIGETPATRLVELAILLDHGKTFPFVEAQRLDKFLPKDASLARAVMSDLIVRHTKRFDHKKETLRRIAGLIKVKPTSLLTSGDAM